MSNARSNRRAAIQVPVTYVSSPSLETVTTDIVINCEDPAAVIEAYLHSVPPELLEHFDLVRHWLNPDLAGDANRQYGLDWGLILPASAQGDAIADALKPLIQHRGGKTVLRYKAADDQRGTISQIAQWIGANSSALRKVNCILIAGASRDLPFELERLLSPTHLVGRLSFDLKDVDPYATPYRTYADKLIRAEKTVATPKGALLFHSIWSPDDNSTRYVFERVTEPLVSALANTSFSALPTLSSLAMSCSQVGSTLSQSSPPQFEGRPILRSTSNQELVNSLSSINPSPTLLVATCHGLEIGSDPTHPQQGALVETPWITFGPAELDTIPTPVLPSGVTFLYACNSAGTPHLRNWTPLVSRCQVKCPEFDHVSVLAQSLLSRDDGPLAVIGHVDVAFVWGLADETGAFTPPDKDLRGAHFHDVIESLLEGVPVGAAIRSIQNRSNHLSSLLISRYFTHKPGATPAAVGVAAQRLASPPLDNEEAHYQLVTLCQYLDCSGWIVLGDPLATLEGQGGRISLKQLLRGDHSE